MRYGTVSLLILAAMCTAVFAHAKGHDEASLKSYDVALVTLETPVTRADSTGRNVTLREVYLVRLLGKFPVNYAKPMELFIGDRKIGEYGSMPGGIYFIVLDKASLDHFAGKEFGYRLEGSDIKPLKTTFSPEKFAPFSPMPEKEAIQRK